MIGWLSGAALGADAHLCVARPGRFVGSAVPYVVRAQDRPVVRLRNDRWVCLEAEPGRYVVSVTGNFADVTVVSTTEGLSTGIGGTHGLGDQRTVDLVAGADTCLLAELAARALLWREVAPDACRGGAKKPIAPSDLFLDQWPGGHLVVDPLGPPPASGPPVAAPEPVPAAPEVVPADPASAAPPVPDPAQALPEPAAAPAPG